MLSIVLPTILDIIFSKLWNCLIKKNARILTAADEEEADLII